MATASARGAVSSLKQQLQQQQEEKEEDEEDNDIVSLDPAVPIDPKPLIADIRRTRYCIPGSVFLVEAIERDILVGSRHRAVRVVLGDGELGKEKEVEGDGVGETDKVEEGEAPPVVAAAESKAVVGVSPSPSPAKQFLKAPPFTPRKSQVPPGGRGDTEEPKPSAGKRTTPAFTPSSASRSHAVKILDADEDISDSDDDDDDFETLEVSAERAAERRRVLTTTSQTVARPLFLPPTSKKTTTAATVVTASSNKDNKSLPWMADDPTRPLRLTTLHSIPNLPYKQNWMCNVLAVVASLSELEPAHLPPHSQRTARLADPTTDKRVLLTVFLEPETFTPAVGSVVLLVGVKNHRFDGGSLKKYVSDRPKNGGSWWVREPEGLEWCRGDVVALREWWEEARQGGGGG
ncbi:hypothetical protein QBC47DRAFT_361776 [Echria macrotheca]|uniref:Cyclin-like F-box n=1 Tax=Echria macrotheca TaxID=438768 RepID=A0AAJ0BAK0_9PEZI|nr:hypothetical protein QBC47DRAFT_361776 [Echria macrotheca]